MSMKKIFIGFAVVALLLGVSFTSVKAATIDELNAMIAQLSAQIAALQGGSPMVTSAPVPPLKVGSSGIQVTALQNFLISKMYSIPAGATGYFGTQTKTALIAFQLANNISPAVGYYGSITAGVVSTMMVGVNPPPMGNYPPGCTSNSGYSMTTGSPCSGGSNLPPGCTSTMGFSPTTGVKCDGSTTPGGSDNALSGGAGSVDSYDEMSKFSNEQVGEEEEDVEIAGLEIEADDGSDLEITAVRLDFSTQPGNDDLDEFITEVSLWLDGEEVARVDADEFNDDNDWTKTVTLDDGAVIAAGETAELVVAVSGVSNVDSGDAGDDWGLDFISVRFVDGQGASVTDTTGTDAFTWDVNTFATATGVDLKTKLSSDNPDSGTVDVDPTDDTDDVELLSFTLEADGSDIEVKDLPINFATSTGGTATTLASVAATVYLVIDGEEYSENTSGSQVVQGPSGATVTFDDIDYTITDGDTVTILVKADINDTEAGAFVDGDALTASFTASNRNSMDAEDETGEDLASNDKSGTASGNAQVFYAAGIRVTLVSTDETLGSTDGADNDSGTFVIKYRVEAIDGTVYVSDTTQATTDVSEDGIEELSLTTAGGGVVYVVDEAGTATVTGVSALVTFEDVAGDPTDSAITNGVELEDGEIAEFTLTVNRQNAGLTNDDGIYRMLFDAIGWATSDTTTLNVYDFNLEDFKTDPISLN